jgi:hypothetical protein
MAGKFIVGVTKDLDSIQLPNLTTPLRDQAEWFGPASEVTMIQVEGQYLDRVRSHFTQEKVFDTLEDARVYGEQLAQEITGHAQPTG